MEGQIKQKIKKLYEKLSKDTLFAIEVNKENFQWVTLDTKIKSTFDFYLDDHKENFWQFKDIVFDKTMISSKLTFRHVGMVPSFFKGETSIEIKPADTKFEIRVAIHKTTESKSDFDICFSAELHPILTTSTTIENLVLQKLSEIFQRPNYKVAKVTFDDGKEWDSETLNHLKIWDKSRVIYVSVVAKLQSPLSLKRKNDPKSMLIFVKDLQGKYNSFYVLPNDTIDILQQMIEYELDIPIFKQRMIYGGRELRPEETMKYYNIQTESTLHLVLSLRGGMYHMTSGRNGFELLSPYVYLENAVHMTMSYDDLVELEKLYPQLEEGSVEKNMVDSLLKLQLNP